MFTVKRGPYAVSVPLVTGYSVVKVNSVRLIMHSMHSLYFPCYLA